MIVIRKCAMMGILMISNGSYDFYAQQATFHHNMSYSMNQLLIYPLHLARL